MRKVSIVIPCYNVSTYLDRCMEHLIKQTIGMENIEIILVDDASTDDGATWELIMDYEQRFPDTVIAIHLEQNMRQGGARNVGISYAGGEYLMFCDADDWLALDAVECVYGKAKEYDVDVVEYRMQNVDDRTDISSFSTQEGDKSTLLELDTDEKRKSYLCFSDNICSLGCMRKLYRMSLIRNHDIRFAQHLVNEEPSFTVPVRIYEKRHYFLDKLVYFYYMSPESTMRGNWDNRKLDNAKVWAALMNDLEERGVMQKYYDEISYMFFRWEFELSIRMILIRGYILEKDEVEFLVNGVLDRFPDIHTNPYLQECEELQRLLLTVLDMQITDESVQVLNQILKKYIKSWNE